MILWDSTAFPSLSSPPHPWWGAAEGLLRQRAVSLVPEKREKREWQNLAAVEAKVHLNTSGKMSRKEQSFPPCNAYLYIISGVDNRDNWPNIMRPCILVNNFLLLRFVRPKFLKKSNYQQLYAIGTGDKKWLEHLQIVEMNALGLEAFRGKWISSVWKE